MARSRDLKVVITGDADKLNRELKRANGSLDKLGKQTRITSSVTSRGFAGIRVAAVGATAAFGGLALAGKKVVDAAIESEKSQARLRAQLKASGISYTAHAKEIDAVIQKHSQLAGVDDEDLQDAFTAIVRTTGSVSTAMRDMGLVTDLARAKNMDVAKAGDAVAKIHAGQYRALKTLNLEFVKSTDNVDRLKASKDKITPSELAAAKAADVQANAQRALGLVQDKVRGQAEAYGKTTQGAMERAGVAVEGLQEDIGAALAPTVEKAANTLAKFVNEMQTGEGAGGRFADKLKDIWSEAKPIVTWIGRATRNVAQFTAEHPGLAKLVTGIVAVGAAVKALRFVSAVTGFTALLKAGRVAATGLKRVLASGGTAAGEAAAANAASSFSGHKGKFSSAGRTAGRAFSRGIGLGMLAGVGLIATEFSDGLVDKVRSALGDRVGNAVQDAMPGGRVGRWGRDKLRGLLGGIFRNAGGIIPGQGNTDTVPAMLTPGEFVIRKRVVEKYGPTFFSAINEGKAPQKFTSGGIVARANKLDGMRIPYLYGGGHGTRDGFNKGGMDCSASVSYALGISPRVSGALMSFGRPGPGSPNDTKIYANPGHVFAVFNGRGWGTSRENPGGGPGWLSYNHRTGFTIRHLEDGDEKGTGSSGDPQETVESGKSSAGPSRSERAARSGSRAVNRIAAKFGRGISAAVRGAAAVGQVVEQAEGGYGRSERFFGQVIGGQAGVFGDEDLNTPEGRAQRTTEVQALKKLKQQQLARLNKRKGLLKRAISKASKQLSELRKARDKAKGAKRAKMSERIRAFDDRLVDLKAELAALGEQISDTTLDIGDLDKDLGELAQAPEVEAGPSTTDKLGQALGDIDLQERAGLLSPEQARAARIATLTAARDGAFGALSQRELWEVMGQLREAADAQAQATVDNTSALRDLKASIDAQLAFADRVSAVTSLEAVRAMADVMSGQLGARVQARSQLPGSGALSRL